MAAKLDYSILGQITEQIYLLDDMDDETVKGFFKWVSASIQTNSVAVGDNKIVVPEKKVSKFIDESYIGKEVIMGIRPENIHDDEAKLAEYASATIDVDVEVTELMGSETYLYLSTTGKEGNIIARVDPRTSSKAGQKIKIALDTNHLHFFDKETEKTILNK